jgi:hypothetical protein
MRLISGAIAAPLLVLLGVACSTVSPDECWVNTSGGFGGSGTMPIGAGVGAVGSGAKTLAVNAGRAATTPVRRASTSAKND